MAVTLNASTTTGLEIASDTSGIVTLRNNGTDALSVNSGNLQFNSGYGSVATAYGCRAWVNFNGTGTVAIRASGNVTSITDNGTGNYTINFTNALPDTNYCVIISGEGTSSVNMTIGGVRTFATGSATIDVGSVGTSSSIPSDRVSVLVAIFR
jgi:hypothetical protein